MKCAPVVSTPCKVALGLATLAAVLPVGLLAQQREGSQAAATQTAANQTARTFAVQGDHFALNGKPFRIISGEMHYARIPRADWRLRLRMAHAMGLNAITTYVFWNLHETQPGVFDFSGQKDVAEFIREAQQEGLYVLLRPGPYVCAEWEWGGYPAWLIPEHAVVRSSDAVYQQAAGRWLQRLGEELSPLQIGNGGPILAVQVENEYGSFGDDHAYMEQVKTQLQQAGFTKAMLYTADGADVLSRGSLPELPAAINFGTGDAERSFALLKKARPQGPFIAGEYWAGWFDHWGEAHQEKDTATQVAEFTWMLRQGYSVSLYMFHGGTSFGWMNGANADHGRYQPDVTSYDYGAALDESGRPTPKYWMFRDAIAKATGQSPLPVPSMPAAQAIAGFTLAESTPLLAQLPSPVSAAEPKSMEALGQSFGYVLYRRRFAEPAAGTLKLAGLHDYAQVRLNDREVGTVDRRLGQDSLDVSIPAGAELDVLVENGGRVNYGPALRDASVGVTSFTLDNAPLQGWQSFPLPLSAPAALRYGKAPCTGACLYRGSFTLEQPTDSFLDTTGIAKGFVWLNGHPLGRAWNIGPQRTLFLPGAWLHAGANDIIVLDLEGHGAPTLRGLDHPVLNAPVASGAAAVGPAGS